MPRNTSTVMDACMPAESSLFNVAFRLARKALLLGALCGVSDISLASLGANAAAAAEIEIAKVEREEPIDFAVDVLPILRRNCLACHSGSVAEGDLVLETPEKMLAGGNEGPAIVPGDPEGSYLIELAAHRSEPVMPPAGNKASAANLKPEELGIIAAWIEQGATPGSLGKSQLEFEPLPSGIVPIYSVAISPDSRMVAATRANQVFLQHLDSKRSLGRLTDPQLLEQGMYSRPGVADVDLVQALAFSPDSQRLATGGYRTVKVWKRAAPGIRKTIDLPGAVRAVAVAPAGDRIAVVHDPATLAMIDAATATVLQSQPLGDLSIQRLAFASGGETLVGATSDAIVAFSWKDSISQRGRAAIEGGVVDLIEIPQRNAVAVAAGDRRIHLFAADAAGENWIAAQTLAGPTAAITVLATTSVEHELLVGDEAGNVQLWDLNQSVVVRSFAHGGPVRALAASGPARRLISFGDASSVRGWNLDDGSAVGSRDGRSSLEKAAARAQHQAALSTRLVELAQQDLAAAQAAKTAEEANVTAAQEAEKKAQEDLAAKLAAYEAAEAARVTAAMAAETAAAALTAAETNQAGDEAIAAARTAKEAADQALTPATEAAKKAMDEHVASQRSVEGATRTLERAREALQRAADVIPLREADVATASSARDASQASATAAGERFTNERPAFLAAISMNATDSIAAIASDGLWSGYQAVDALPLFFEPAVAAGDAVALASAAVARRADAAGHLWWGNGTKLIAASAEETWEWERTIGSFSGESPFADRVTAIDFSPDGTVLAVGGGLPSRSGTITLVEVASGNVVREFDQPHSDVVLNVRFSPDGKLLASCGTDRFMKTFAVDTGTVVRNFEGHTHHVQSVAWSADGRTLVTAGSDLALKVWNAGTGEQLRTIGGFGKEVTGVRFLGLGTVVAASSGDRNVHLKNSADGGAVRQLGGFADFVYAVDVSWDGRVIAAGGLDGILRVFAEDGTLLSESAAP